MSDVVSLNHVVVYAADLEAARRFYTCLGLELQSEQHGKGPVHYAAELPGMVFEIYSATQNSVRGALRLGFQVADLNAVVDALRQQSVKIHSEPQDSPWGRRAVVEDADGNKVELTERR
jgi:catechol 2,3-dioxygenase-like lactoylglutathione lyase family enzyme